MDRPPTPSSIASTAPAGAGPPVIATTLTWSPAPAAGLRVPEAQRPSRRWMALLPVMFALGALGAVLLVGDPTPAPPAPPASNAGLLARPEGAADPTLACILATGPTGPCLPSGAGLRVEVISRGPATTWTCELDRCRPSDPGSVPAPSDPDPRQHS